MCKIGFQNDGYYSHTECKTPLPSGINVDLCNHLNGCFCDCDNNCVPASVMNYAFLGGGCNDGSVVSESESNDWEYGGWDLDWPVNLLCPDYPFYSDGCLGDDVLIDGPMANVLAGYNPEGGNTRFWPWNYNHNYYTEGELTNEGFQYVNLYGSDVTCSCECNEDTIGMVDVCEPLEGVPRICDCNTNCVYMKDEWLVIENDGMRVDSGLRFGDGQCDGFGGGDPSAANFNCKEFNFDFGDCCFSSCTEINDIILLSEGDLNEYMILKFKDTYIKDA